MTEEEIKNAFMNIYIALREVGLDLQRVKQKVHDLEANMVLIE